MNVLFVAQEGGAGGTVVAIGVVVIVLSVLFGVMWLGRNRGLPSGSDGSSGSYGSDGGSWSAGGHGHGGHGG